MAVKRRLPAGAQSSSGDATPTTTVPVIDGRNNPKTDIWSAENELKLLQVLMTHKPFGISKHFQMVLVLNKLSQDGLKSITGQMISDHIEKYYGISALDTLHNTALPLALQSSSSGETPTILNKSDSTISDSNFTEFQLPLKGFYRHFKEMTETSGVTVEDAEIYFPQETPKTTGIKRPTRSTPSSGNNGPTSKRRK